MSSKKIKSEPVTPERVVVLEAAAELISGEREASYGNPIVQMDFTGQLFRMYQAHAGDKYSGAHDAAMHMLLNKISRIACGQHEPDNYIDGAGYLAIAQECEVVLGEVEVEE